MAGSPVRLRLDEVLRELGWTQKELAEKAGLSRQSINSLVHNPIFIRLDTLEKLSHATGVPVSDLIVQE